MTYYSEVFLLSQEKNNWAQIRLLYRQGGAEKDPNLLILPPNRYISPPWPTNIVSIIIYKIFPFNYTHGCTRTPTQLLHSYTLLQLCNSGSGRFLTIVIEQPGTPLDPRLTVADEDINKVYSSTLG